MVFVSNMRLPCQNYHKTLIELFIVLCILRSAEIKMSSILNNLINEPIIIADPDINTWDYIKAVKKTFIEKGITPVSNQYLPKEVIESWIISKNYNVDPDMHWPPPRLSKKNIESVLKKNKLLIKIFESFILGYKKILKETAHNMVLYDAGSVVIAYSLEQPCDEINIGGVLEERVAGSSVPTMTARYKRPVQTIGPANYCSALERYIGSAAPIFDESGDVVGSIALFRTHSTEIFPLRHSLGWVTSTAMAISSQLYLQKREERPKIITEVPEVSVHNHEKTRSNEAADITVKAENMFDDIVHQSPQMRDLIETAKTVGKNPVNIMLLGESGTGKELFARAIHEMYCDGPFVVINCASLPANLIESELFGYEKGAFTGADTKGKKGIIEHANGGTLFLDEIGDMPLHLQPVLLRALEEKKITRIGGCKNIPVDFRIISATNKKIYDDVKNRMFREDLYFRLSVVNLEIPPLRERIGDALLLAEIFAGRICKRFKVPRRDLSGETREIISRYNWPGNVRQLENAMTYAVSLAKNDVITPENLPREIVTAIYDKNDKFAEVREIESKIMNKIVNESENMEEAARQLGMSRSTLYRKLRERRIADTSG